MAEDKKYMPLLPFDATWSTYFSTYDTIPYRCNRDLCHPMIMMSTGNIVKYYTYNLEGTTAIDSELAVDVNAVEIS